MDTNREPLVVAMLNQKGGVGKTTNCFHLSGAFSKLGKKVLLVDLDPQANLTQGFWGPKAVEGLDPMRSVVRLFDESMPEPDFGEVLSETPVENVWILPGHERLERYDETRPEERGTLQFVLKNFIREVLEESDYGIDVVLIDCRPTLNLLGWNALLASNRMMVPFQPEDFGSQGVIRVQRKFDEALANHNRTLRHLGYVQTMVDARAAIHKAYSLTLRQMYGDQVFEQVVPRAVAFAEAVSARQTIHQYKPRVKAAKAMEALAKEMLDRHEALSRQAPEFLYSGNYTQTNTTVDTNIFKEAV